MRHYIICLKYFISAKNSIKANDFHDEQSSDDGVIFRSDADTVDYFPSHPVPITTGPKIKEIGSNCSSLAESPQYLPSSPPKSLMERVQAMCNEDRSSFDSAHAILNISKSVSSIEITNKTSDIESKSSKSIRFSESLEKISTKSIRFSEVSENVSEISEPNGNVAFTLDSEDEELETDGSAGTSKQHSSERSRMAFKRSFSLDPVMSGETRPKGLCESHYSVNDFTESDFPLQVRGCWGNIISDGQTIGC